MAVAAARLRGVLVDAAACQRQGNELELLEQLLHVVGILTSFPLPQGSPQADMIAAAVQQRATLPERQVLPCTLLHIALSALGCLSLPKGHCEQLAPATEPPQANIMAASCTTTNHSFQCGRYFFCHWGTVSVADHTSLHITLEH